MRNWNLSEAVEWLIELRLQTLPMRNWNVIVSSNISFSSSLQTLPMRNWNEKMCQHLSEQEFLQTLPMRNWNSAFVPRINATWRSRHYLWGIETTWEFERGLLWMSPDTTYEELKHCTLSFTSFKINCSRHYLWGIETTNFVNSRQL